MATAFKNFLDLVYNHFNAVEKKRVLEIHRNYGTRIEKWLQVEIGLALDDKLKTNDQNLFFRDWGLEVPEYTTSKNHKAHCDIYTTTKDGNFFPVSGDNDALWIELKCRTTMDVGGRSSLKSGFEKDIAKLRLTANHQSGHFIFVAIIIFDKTKSTNEKTVKKWKDIFPNIGDCAFVVDKVVKEIKCQNDELLAFLIGIEFKF